MAKKILVVYATNAGSTADVAKAIAEELERDGTPVEVRPVQEVSSVEGYTAVVIGAPMIMGWHRAARRFVRQHRPALSRVPVAYCFTALSLTQTPETTVDGVPLYVDPQLAQPPRRPGRLSLRERYATTTRYLRPVLRPAPAVKPVSVGFFAGKLEYFRLNLLQMIVALVLAGGKAGDFRHWEAIRAWATDLRPLLQGH